MFLQVRSSEDTEIMTAAPSGVFAGASLCLRAPACLELGLSRLRH